MFDLPNISVDAIGRFADWMEFCTVFEKGGLVSRAKLADVACDSGLVGSLSSDLLPGDISYTDSDDFSEDDATERFAGIVFEELDNRKNQAGDAYPFTIERDSLRRSVDSWADVPAFGTLLIADLSRSYVKVGVKIETNSTFSHLFEKVVEAASQGLLQGRGARFGWPKETGWPTKINDRIQVLGDKIGIEVNDLSGLTHANDKDRGLDVVTQLSFGDKGPATLFLLTQCATGKHWKKKKGEPSITEWADIFRWNAYLLRAVAIPWRLDKSTDSGFDRIRTFRHFDSALVLDRPRLVAGNPDRHLDTKMAKSMRQWCKEQLPKFPKLR
jgi:hypothetical protein